MEYQVDRVGPVVTLVDDVVQFGASSMNPRYTQGISEELLQPKANAVTGSSANESVAPWSRYDQQLFHSLNIGNFAPSAADVKSKAAVELILPNPPTFKESLGFDIGDEGGDVFGELIDEYSKECADSTFIQDNFGIDFNHFYYRIDEIPPSLYTSEEVAALMEKEVKDVRELVPPPPPLYYDPKLYSAALSADSSDGADGVSELELEVTPEEREMMRQLDWFTNSALEHTQTVDPTMTPKRLMLPTKAIMNLREELLADWLTRAEGALLRATEEKRNIILQALVQRAIRERDSEHAYQNWCERKDVLCTEEKMKARQAARRISEVFRTCVNANTRPILRRFADDDSESSSNHNAGWLRPTQLSETFEEWLGGALERLRLTRLRRFIEKRKRLAGEDDAVARRAAEVEAQILTWRQGVEQERIHFRQQAALRDRIERLAALRQAMKEEAAANSVSPRKSSQRTRQNLQAIQRQEAALRRAAEDRAKARSAQEQRTTSLVDMTGVALTGRLATDLDNVIVTMKPSDRKFVRWLWNTRPKNAAKREGLKLLLTEAEEVERQAARPGSANMNEEPTTRLDATLKRLGTQPAKPKPRVWR